MIRYALKCTAEHGFESWFKSADAFDALLAGGLVACPVCGSAEVAKALMAPPVRASRKATGVAEVPLPTRGALTAPANDGESALLALKKKVEANSDYVGKDFAREARRMHVGDAPERSIYGEARLEDARKLLDDGIPVAPLPFLPQRKIN